MAFETNRELYISVEKGFSSYIKSCLTHKSSKIFKSYDQERIRFRSLNDFNEKALTRINGFTTLTSISEEENSLFEVLRSLNSLERRLIYLKFHEEKTDWEIAKTLGVSRQAVTKAKKKLLKKMKTRLEL
ncbi:sigma factor-like helix-turn-helix DNA-binding protein [Paenibacillus sp. FSL R10-2791]|uniref:sigma factor-like helix-turn-helix DNA-binding protein n=1 Tax=Paenibacillus sp. FSL R10-2791 TaxID=2954695 RepID=UPI0030F670EF